MLNFRVNINLIKFILVAILGFSCILGSDDISYSKAKDISVEINGKEVSYDEAPFIENGRTLVPFRYTMEVLGYDIEWKPVTRRVIGTTLDTKVELTIDSNIAVVNEKTIKMDVTAKIVAGRTFVPLRFLAESSGATVEWDEVNNIVIITKLDKEDINDCIQEKFQEKIVYNGIEIKFQSLNKIENNQEGNRVEYFIKGTLSTADSSNFYIRLHDNLGLTSMEYLFVTEKIGDKYIFESIIRPMKSFHKLVLLELLFKDKNNQLNKVKNFYIEDF